MFENLNVETVNFSFGDDDDGRWDDADWVNNQAELSANENSYEKENVNV